VDFYDCRLTFRHRGASLGHQRGSDGPQVSLNFEYSITLTRLIRKIQLCTSGVRQLRLALNARCECRPESLRARRSSARSSKPDPRGDTYVVSLYTFVNDTMLK